MVYKKSLNSRYCLSPGEKSINISMTAYTWKLSYTSCNPDSLTKELYTLCAVNKCSAQCIARLISNEKNSILFFPKVMLKMMLDTSCLAHTAGRNDDLGTRILINSTRIIAAYSPYKVCEADRIYTLTHKSKSFLVIAAFTVADKYIRGLICKRAVNVNRESIMTFYKSLRLDMAYEIEHFLCPADCKRRNYNTAATIKSLLKNSCKGRSIVRRSIVNTISIGGLHNNIIGSSDTLRITYKRLLCVAYIA